MPRSSVVEAAGIGRDLQVVHAAGIGRGLQAQLARRIAAQHVTLQHAVAHQRRLARRHAFGIEGRRAQAARQERLLVDGEPVGEDPRAGTGRAGSWRAGTARRRTPRRAGGRSASARPRPRTAPGTRRSRSERGARRARVRSAAWRPIAPAASRSSRASALLYQPSRCMSSPCPAISAQPMRVLGAALAAEEAVRVGVHRHAFAAADRGAVGVGDARVAARGRPPRRPAPGRSRGRRRAPTDARRRGRAELRCAISAGIGQAGGCVVLGVAGDRAGLRDGGLQAFLAQVGGAGAALALAEVDGHARCRGRGWTRRSPPRPCAR